MARREITGNWTRDDRNAINENFRQLFEEHTEAGLNAEEALEKAEQAVADALLAKETAEVTREEMLAIIQEQTRNGDLAPEIAQARQGYDTVGENLDSIKQELLEKANQTDVDNINQELGEKANQADLEAKADKVDLDLKLDKANYNQDKEVSDRKISDLEINKASKQSISELSEAKADKTQLTQGLSQKRDLNVEIGMGDLNQQVREAFTGGSTPVVGPDSVGNANLRRNAVTRDKMHNNYAINYPYLSDGSFDLDYVWDQGNFYVNEAVKNNPFGAGCTLKIERYKTTDSNSIVWLTQTATNTGDAEKRGLVAQRALYISEANTEIRWVSDWTYLNEVNQPLKILTVGNSFGLDATKYIHKICESVGINVISGNLYIGGGLLEEQYNNIQNNNDVYRYYRRYFVDGELTDDYLTDYTVDDALALYNWDYVFFNQRSADSGDYSTFQPFLTDIINYVKDRQPNAKIALMPTWAYASDLDDERFDKYGRDQMTMFNDTLNAYKEAMEDVDFDTLIPAGTAIQNARTDEYLNLVDRELTRDGYHLSDTGSFIAGMTLFRSLIDASSIVDYIPETVSKKSAYLGKIAAENAVLNPFKITEI